MNSKLAALLAINQTNRAGLVDRFAISPLTATKILNLYNQLSPRFQKKFLAQRADIMASLATRDG